MIIQSDSFTMESKRQFASRRTTELSITTEGGEGPSGRGNFLSTLHYTKGAAAGRDEMSQIPAVRQGRMSTLQRVGAMSSDMENLEDASLSVKFSALNYLFRLFFGDGKSISDMQDPYGYWAVPTANRYQTIQFSEVYEESEVTSFSASGKVKTEDGREIDFALNVGMSRSFYEETNLDVIRKMPQLMDPLVVNLRGNVDAISDQTFFFDLDGDGEKEEVASLNKGHGFLALDKNEDGEINDGSELFGALSGDGFAELAAYDLDGNGWIDEADEIFDKLRVWSLDEKGDPMMFTLAESDIGAICLASAPTTFSVNDEENRTRAMVRQTGFFLHESSGEAGTVQQIDLAVAGSKD